MRISIRIKHSIFLAMLLSLTVFVLSVLVLDEIKKEHMIEYEDILASYGKTANLYINELYFSKGENSYQQFLNYNGAELASHINKLINKQVVIYDINGNKMGTTLSITSNADVIDVLPYAAKGKAAYKVEGNMLYYLTPLFIRSEQVGVIQFSYSIKPYEDSYNKTRSTFIVVGVLVLILSFLVATLYFNSFTNGILKLKAISDRIKNGNYSVPVLKRRDELGDLSEGIYYMSCQIHNNIESMNEEQKKLSLAVEKLTKLEKEQKRFIGNISHEFKTPLTSIRAYIDLVSMYPDDSILLEQAKDVIDKETSRLGNMVDKVLKLSELEKYDFEQDVKRIEISELIEAISNNMKGRMERFGISLEMKLERVYILADKENITHILVNVLDNAIKYNLDQGKISVKCFNQGNFAHIEVENTGAYIQEEEREKVFEPFYRIDKNRSRQTGGTGLGLALVKELVIKQRGTISVKDSDTEKTVFLIIFPSIN
ncbi:MAG TPA: HAMP domain-containing sensor histidine kinase [Clostridia bacterium]